MINFDKCSRSQLEEVVEALAYKVAQYENPTWTFIYDCDVLSILRTEGLDVEIEERFS